MSETVFIVVKDFDSKGHRSAFLSLPPEVRNLIYQYLFTNTSVIILAPDDHRTSSLLNILFVNRLCYQEAKPVFYSQTTFHLRFGSESNLQGPSCVQVREKFGKNAQHVSHVYYHYTDPKFVFQLQEVLPNLKVFEMFLGEGFFHSDQTNFDRAMRYALRYGEWKYAIKNALDERFGPGMRDAVARLRFLGPNRGFVVKLHWSMSYRFVDFRGHVDLDEWILRIRDPDGKSAKVFEIPQERLEPTWCEGRLTLPWRESSPVEPDVLDPTE